MRDVAVEARSAARQRGQRQLRLGAGQPAQTEVRAVGEGQVGLSARATSRRSGSSNCAGSRLAAPITRMAPSPFGIATPPIETSSSAIRAVACTTPSKRRNSSTAVRIRPGSAVSRRRWSGCRSSASTALPIRLVVVSCPATRISTLIANSSSASRRSPSTSARTSSLTRSSRGRARRSATTPSKKPRISPRHSSPLRAPPD